MVISQCSIEGKQIILGAADLGVALGMFVMETLQQRGVGARQRSAVLWALMAAQLRGVATGELLAGAESNPDARFVMHQLAARGIAENERADVLWAMLAAYLRGEVAAQLPQDVMRSKNCTESNVSLSPARGREA